MRLDGCASSAGDESVWPEAKRPQRAARGLAHRDRLAVPRHREFETERVLERIHELEPEKKRADVVSLDGRSARAERLSEHVGLSLQVLASEPLG